MYCVSFHQSLLDLIHSVYDNGGSCHAMRNFRHVPEANYWWRDTLQMFHLHASLSNPLSLSEQIVLAEAETRSFSKLTSMERISGTPAFDDVIVERSINESSVTSPKRKRIGTSVDASTLLGRK
jgi:hypothetical protein